MPHASTRCSAPRPSNSPRINAHGNRIMGAPHAFLICKKELLILESLQQHPSCSRSSLLQSCALATSGTHHFKHVTHFVLTPFRHLVDASIEGCGFVITESLKQAARCDAAVLDEQCVAGEAKEYWWARAPKFEASCRRLNEQRSQQKTTKSKQQRASGKKRSSKLYSSFKTRAWSSCQLQTEP